MFWGFSFRRRSKRKCCRWNSEEEKKIAENKDVEKENALTGTQKKKRKTENGNVEKEKV